MRIKLPQIVLSRLTSRGNGYRRSWEPIYLERETTVGADNVFWGPYVEMGPANSRTHLLGIGGFRGGPTCFRGPYLLIATPCYLKHIYLVGDRRQN